MPMSVRLHAPRRLRNLILFSHASYLILQSIYLNTFISSSLSSKREHEEASHGMEHCRTRSEASRRTNSLAFAKNDCHTCTSLKKQCDRQRPRCGTCLSDKRKCDGFAMPLVWTGSARNNSPSGPTPHQKGGPCTIAEFKFIQGRPKRKRKPKSSISHEISRHQGYFAVSTSPPAEAAQEKAQIEPALIDSESIPLLLFEPQTVGEASAEFADGLWESQSLSDDAMSSDWIEPQPQLKVSSCLGLDASALTMPASHDLLTFDEEGTIEIYRSMESVLPPMILYQDLSQKYHHILEMCKISCHGSKGACLAR